MNARFIIGVVFFSVTGCASTPDNGKLGWNSNAVDLTVNLASNIRQVLDSVPAESAMEYFEMLDQQGRIITYIAFTDTATGALVFVDNKLKGTLSHHAAQAFYICRGYVTTAPNHWARDAADWEKSLLNSITPVSEIKLKFSGKSTTQSIKEVAESPFLKKLKLLFNMGTNPLNIFNSLSKTKNEIEERNKFEKVQKGLSLISPGMSESSVDAIMHPEDVSFVGGGTVMAYPSHLVEFFVADGVVKVIQQPSLYFLSKTNAALFYAANTKWSLCTPQHWREALPEKTAETKMP